MSPGKGMYILRIWTDGPCGAILLLLRPWMGNDYIVIQVVCWVELPDFCENMDPNKWDTIVRYRVTRNPEEFCRLTGCQRDLRI